MALSLRQNETAYAMHSKGVEYPAYLPHTNPSYPWALAGGHMSMRTYILAIVERETDLEYWVDATVNRGPRFILDDITGLCKFSMISPDLEVDAIRLLTGLEVNTDELLAAVDRTFLRGYACERKQGFVEADYTMPADAHKPIEHSSIPQFNTEKFFGELRERVMATLDQRAAAAGFL